MLAIEPILSRNFASTTLRAALDYANRIRAPINRAATPPCPADQSAGLTLVRLDPIAGLNTCATPAYSAARIAMTVVIISHGLARAHLRLRGPKSVAGLRPTEFKRCLRKCAELFNHR